MLLLAALVGVAALLLFTPTGLARILLRQNFQVVVPGVYRSAQPTRADLERWTDEYSLEAILNLRRIHEGVDWWKTERDFVRERGMAHQTIKLNADRMPPVSRLVALVDGLDRAPRPLLIHCQGGIERTGLGAAVAVLLDGGSPARAREEFDRSRGFVEWAAFSDLPRVVDDYAAWLDAASLEHRPDHFRRWAREDYVPYFYRADLEPSELGAQRLAVRVTNTSGRVIPFRAAAPPGVRLGAHWKPRGGDPVELRGEPIDRDLEPGETITLRIDRPRDTRAGVLVVDLVDEGVEWFADMGSPPLEIALSATTP